LRGNLDATVVGNLLEFSIEGCVADEVGIGDMSSVAADRYDAFGDRRP
jgi:hypothetical protein